MGNYHTNNLALPITLMRKFLTGSRNVSSYYNLDVEGLPKITFFRSSCESDGVNSRVEKLDEIRRNEKTDFRFEDEIYEPMTIGKLDSLSNDDVAVISDMLDSRVLI